MPNPRYRRGDPRRDPHAHLRRRPHRDAAGFSPSRRRAPRPVTRQRRLDETLTDLAVGTNHLCQLAILYQSPVLVALAEQQETLTCVAHTVARLLLRRDGGAA